MEKNEKKPLWTKPEIESLKVEQLCGAVPQASLCDIDPPLSNHDCTQKGLNFS